MSARGWLLDIIGCIDKMKKSDFVLEDVYKFESELAKLHPENSHIKDKIRQQLQILRDKHFLEFTARGKYHLI